MALAVQQTKTEARRARSATVRGRIVKGAVIASGVAVPLFSTGVANAATPDPATDLTGGSGDTFFTSLTSYFTGHVLISVLALLALVVGAGMLIGWGRKAAKAK